MVQIDFSYSYTLRYVLTERTKQWVITANYIVANHQRRRCSPQAKPSQAQTEGVKEISKIKPVLLVNVHRQSRVQGLLRALVGLLQGRINHLVLTLAVGVLAALQPVTDGLAEELDDADVLQPVLVGLGLAVDVTVI